MKEITKKQDIENCSESFVTFYFSAKKEITEKMMVDLDRKLMRGVEHWFLEGDGLHVALNDERDYCVNWAKGFMAGWLVATEK